MNAEPITTGRTGLGMRWAEAAGWLVMAYAKGGYSVQVRAGGGGWRLLGKGEAPPAEVLDALLAALGLPGPGQ
jgi:hypothetical protein